jgi:hypothetical protein
MVIIPLTVCYFEDVADRPIKRAKQAGVCGHACDVSDHQQAFVAAGCKLKLTKAGRMRLLDGSPLLLFPDTNQCVNVSSATSFAAMRRSMR